MARLEEQLSSPPQSPEGVTAEEGSDEHARHLIDLQQYELDMRRYELDRKANEQILAEIAAIEEQQALNREEHERLEAERDVRLTAPQYVMTIHSELPTPRSECVGELDVMIPSTMFGKAWKLTEWLGGRREWPTPARDNCQLRKRAMGEVPIVLGVGIYLFFKFLLGTLCAVGYALFLIPLLLLGYRSLKFDCLIQPFDTSPRDVWRSRKPSFWLYKRAKTPSVPSWNYKYGYSRRAKISLLLNPVAFIVLASLVGAFSYFGATTILVGGSIFASSIFMMVLFSDQIDPRWAAWSSKRREKREATWRDKYEKDLASIGCDIVPRVDPVGKLVLPKQRKLVYVFHVTKSKVCKPFAG